MREAILVFARTPEPGRTKTRLTPPLSADQAAGLYAAFLQDTAHALAALRRPVRWYVAGLLSDFPVAETENRFAQRGSDLGARMMNAAADAIAAGYDRLVLLGTDSPTLPAPFIEQAFACLNEDGGIVLGPANDGGYYLLGMASMLPALFRDMAWSTEGVFQETVRRVQEAGLPLAVLPEWYDVDTPSDLELLRNTLRESGGATAPCTARALEALERTPPNA